MAYKNIEDYKAYQKKYYLKNKELKKLYYLNNKNEISEKKKIYRLKNKEKIKKHIKEYHLKNRHIRTSLNAKRKAAKLKATPKFANLEKIKEIYKNCPKGYQVDHIVPLQGKNVCGLHVEWNLQYLTPSENLSKHNKLLNF
jgi:hypothetical protein